MTNDAARGRFDSESHAAGNAAGEGAAPPVSADPAPSPQAARRPGSIVLHTSADLDLIAGMVRRGNGTAEIAAALGVTRNTVAGLIGRARARGDERFPPARYEGAPGRATRAKLAQVAERRQAEDARLSQPAAAEPGSAVALVTGWRRRQCRWIEGDVRDGAIAGCSHDAAAGQTYCTAHLRRAWMPAEKQPRGSVVRLARAFS